MQINQLTQNIKPLDNYYHIHVNVQEVIKYLEYNYTGATKIDNTFEGYSNWSLMVNSNTRIDFSRYLPFLNIIKEEDVVDNYYSYVIIHEFTDIYKNWLNEQTEYPDYWKFDPSKWD